MRDLLIKLFGIENYVKGLQAANEHLASCNRDQANLINGLRDTIQKWRDANEALTAEKKELNTRIDSQNKLIEELRQSNTFLSDNCNQYNEQCSKFTAKLQSQYGIIGSLKKKLAKYETQDNKNTD